MVFPVTGHGYFTFWPVLVARIKMLEILQRKDQRKKGGSKKGSLSRLGPFFLILRSFVVEERRSIAVRHLVNVKIQE